MTERNNSIVSNLFQDSNNSFLQVSSIQNKNKLQILPTIQYYSPTSANQNMNFNINKYFNPTPFSNYYNICKCTVGNNKRSILRHMNDKYRINISHKQSVSLVNYIEQKITIASSLPNFHNNKMKVIDGYVCACGICLTSIRIIN